MVSGDIIKATGRGDAGELDAVLGDLYLMLCGVGPLAKERQQQLRYTMIRANHGV